MHLLLCIINTLFFAELVGSLYWIFAKVTCSTKEWHKHGHTISQVFLPRFMFGICIPRYTFNVLHSPIMVRLPIRVRQEEIPVPTLLTSRPPSLGVTKVGAEQSLNYLEYTVAGNILSFSVPEPWVYPTIHQGLCGMSGETKPITMDSCIEDDHVKTLI